MNSVFQSICLIIQIILYLAMLLPTLYIFIFSLAGLFYKQSPYPCNPRLRKIAVLIPGYKEDNVIMEVASDALQQDYPKEYFDVIVIADSFQLDTLSLLKTLPIKLIEVKFDSSTKSKALNQAMSQLYDKYDIAVILDADNLMAQDFLSKINASFETGFIAIQGHRTAKNMDTALAVLDAVSEEINNHIFRKGHRALGLSSAIIGSGMAFKYDFFKDLMLTVTAIGGFDKEIELKLLKEGYTIQYLDDAYVFDEKVQKEEVFSNQRRRWLSVQLIYFRKDFIASVKALITRGNIDYFDKAVQFIQPPRILLLGIVLIFGISFFLLNYILDNPLIYIYLWIGIILICVLTFLFSVPVKMYNKKTLKAMIALPKGMLLMLGSLFRIKGANKQFIHTKHGQN